MGHMVGSAGEMLMRRADKVSGEEWEDLAAVVHPKSCPPLLVQISTVLLLLVQGEPLAARQPAGRKSQSYFLLYLHFPGCLRAPPFLAQPYAMDWIDWAVDQYL